MSAIISIASVVVAFIAVLFFWYYSKKSKEREDKSLTITNQQYTLAQNQTQNQYINEACKAFKKEGTPFPYIDSLRVTDDEKEEIWKQCFLRYKRKLPKNSFKQEKAGKSEV